MAGSISDIARWTNAAGDGIWGNANWVAAGGTPTTATGPANGEYALFDARVNADVLSGTSTNLGLCELHEYYGNWGVPGTSVTANATTFRMNAAGTFYLASTATDFYLDKLGGGKMFHTAGTITNMYSNVVTLDIGASAVVTNMNADGTVATAAAGTAFTTLNIRGGQMTSARSLGTAIVAGPGALLVVTGAATAATVLTIQPGANVLWRAGGTLATLNNFGGPTGGFSVEGCPYGFTITNLNGPRTSRFQRYTAAGTGATTITADNRYGGDGGSAGFGA